MGNSQAATAESIYNHFVLACASLILAVKLLLPPYLQEGVTTLAPSDFPGKQLKQLGGVELANIMKFLKSKGFKDPGPYVNGASIDWGSPCLLLDWNGDGHTYAFVNAFSTMFNPGASGAGIFVFSKEGRVVSFSHFYAGDRSIIRSIQATSLPGVGPVVRFRTQPGFGREDVEGFDMSLVDSRPAIIRIFGGNDSLARNRYYAPNFQLGPTPPRASIKDELNSSSPTANLEALTWLAGEHLKVGTEFMPGDKTIEIYHEPYADVGTFGALWNDPRVLQRMTDLSHSPNALIRATAREALAGGGKTTSMNGLEG